MSFKYGHPGQTIDADGAGMDDPTGVQYVYDGQHIALAFDETGSLTNRYLHGPLIDQVLADEQVVDELVAGDVLWALTDNLGSVRDLVDSDGEVVNHIDYDAYGRIAAETAAAISHAFGYTGRERDYESDLQYNRARYYDPATGRWTAEDPIGFAAGDTNLNRYVGNGPTNETDPSGLIAPAAGIAWGATALRAAIWAHRARKLKAGVGVVTSPQTSVRQLPLAGDGGLTVGARLRRAGAGDAAAGRR